MVKMSRKLSGICYENIPRKGATKLPPMDGQVSVLYGLHMLKDNVPFRDLGSDYYDSFNRERKIHGYLKRLQALGWQPDALPGSA